VTCWRQTPSWFVCRLVLCTDCCRSEIYSSTSTFVADSGTTAGAALPLLANNFLGSTGVGQTTNTQPQSSDWSPIYCCPGLVPGLPRAGPVPAQKLLLLRRRRHGIRDECARHHFAWLLHHLYVTCPTRVPFRHDWQSRFHSSTICSQIRVLMTLIFESSRSNPVRPIGGGRSSEIRRAISASVVYWSTWRSPVVDCTLYDLKCAARLLFHVAVRGIHPKSAHVARCSWIYVGRWCRCHPLRCYVLHARPKHTRIMLAHTYAGLSSCGKCAQLPVVWGRSWKPGADENERINATFRVSLARICWISPGRGVWGYDCCHPTEFFLSSKAHDAPQLSSWHEPFFKRSSVRHGRHRHVGEKKCHHGRRGIRGRRAWGP